MAIFSLNLLLALHSDSRPLQIPKPWHGVSRFLDPNLRQRNCYEYYLNNTGDIEARIEDPQLGEFYEAKLSSLWERFPLYNGNDKKVFFFEELRGFELGLQLALSFKAALKSMWLLHKLAFSFEPPTSIFRVEKGAGVDPAYMDAIVKLEDDQRFVFKVGFMVTPGLRLRKTVMLCEVYLSGATTTCDYNPNHATTTCDYNPSLFSLTVARHRQLVVGRMIT